MNVSRNPFAQCFTALVFALLLQQGTAGQAPAAHDAQPPRAAKPLHAEDWTLLTYDVGDLVLNVPDYPYTSADGSALFGRRAGMGVAGSMGSTGGGMMGGMPGGETPVGGGGMQSAGFGQMSLPDSTRITMDDLVRVIVTVVAPDTWAQYGAAGGAGPYAAPGMPGMGDAFNQPAPQKRDGGAGEIQRLGTALIVRQTPAVHRQIDELLQQLRTGSGKRKTVSIDARWLLLTSDDLERLIPAAADSIPRVDREVLAELTRRPSTIRGITNCFTGQLVYLVSGTQQNVVTSFVPVVGSIDRQEPAESQVASLKHAARYVFTQQASQRAVGYQPVIEVPNFGALLEVRPTLIPGDNTATVDLRSTLTAPGKPAEELIRPRPEDILTPTVDRFAIDTQKLATTLNVPLGQPVLVGGMTYISPLTEAMRHGAIDTPRQPEKAPSEVPQLYLILELR